MCGIVGVAGFIGLKQDKMMEKLLILDSMRGLHSTGIVAVPKFGDPTIAKAVGNPFELFNTVTYDKAMKKSNCVIIGHNRYATQGQVNRKNAHPFNAGGLYGVHNGTLKNKYKLLDQQFFDVDSENLYHHMYHNGIDDLLATIDGAWALVWWDNEESSLNFLRNKERPLFLAEDLKTDTLYWASEKWMLEVAAAYCDVEFRLIESMKEDMHLNIVIDEKGHMAKPVVTHRPSTYVNPHVIQHSTGNWKQDMATAFGMTAEEVENFTAKEVAAPSDKGQTKAVLTLRKTATKDDLYAVGEVLTLECLGTGRDSFGGRYLSFFDKANDEADIRLYIKQRNDEFEDLGGHMVEVCIKEVASSFGKKHYKLDGWKVKDLGEVESITIPPEKEILDFKGKPITEENFTTKYGVCAHCDGYVNPKLDFRYTTGGETICHECVTTIYGNNVVQLQ